MSPCSTLNGRTGKPRSTAWTSTSRATSSMHLPDIGASSWRKNGGFWAAEHVPDRGRQPGGPRLRQPAHPDFVPVLDWLQQRDGCLVVGGHLTDELGRLEKARRFVVQLLRAGIARQ